MKRRSAMALAPLAAMLCAAQARADELPPAPETHGSQSWRVSLGTTYSSGRYGGTAQTRVTTAPLIVRYNRDRLSLRLSEPFVHITGPGSLVDTPQGSGGETGSGGDDGAVGTEAPELNDGPGEDAGGDGGETCTPSAEEPCPPPGDGIPGAERPARNGIGDVALTAGYGIDIGRIATLDLAARL